jgi:hypothetical protein
LAKRPQKTFLQIREEEIHQTVFTVLGVAKVENTMAIYNVPQNVPA